MEHNNDIEEFSGGGRISPESSATDFPKGTLGVGKNGKVWINQPDKNGRLSWKPTENEFPISSIFSFGYWDEETFDFQIKLDGKELFNLRYAYEYENSYLKFTYPNGGADREVAGSLDELLDFFNDNFVAETFDLLNTNPNINGTKITTEVKILISRLKFLINNKGLRSPEKPATPEPKFNSQDKVRTLGNKRVMTVSSYIYDRTAKQWKYTLTYDDNKKPAQFFENGLELAIEDEIPEPKFKVGDRVTIPPYPDEYEIVRKGVYVKELSNYQYNVKKILGGSVYEQYETALELYEEPKASKKFWRKLSIADGNIWKTSKIATEKYIYRQWLQTAQNQYVIPAYADENIFAFETAQRTKDLYGVTIAITLDYVKGLSLFINTNKGDFPEIKRDDIVNLNKFREAYEEVLHLINQYTNNTTAKETDEFVSKLLFEIDENNIAFAWKENTLKVGDKVVIPLTKMGKELKNRMSVAWDNAIQRNQKYLYVTEVLQDGKVALNDVKDGDGDYFNENLDNLIVYNEMPETPKTPFQQIDFLSPSTEEYSKLITGMINYSDGLKFNNSRSGVFKIINKDGSETEFSFIFNEVDNTISITPIGRDDLITVSKKIKNENIEEIAKIYWDTFTRITKIGLKFPPKDCEADPNKIISGQVKKFYDLNKTRIEKLDSKFSCKIVQALVSLSEYESCGSPSSSNLPKAKSDLLSRISNLKI